MPVVYSDDSRVTVQAPSVVSATGSYLLYYSWQGL